MVKLFCFPHAGGSSEIYRQWQRHMRPDIEIRPVELAGRGRRISEPYYLDFNAVITDIFSIIGKEIQDGKFAFFGHSMGAKIAFELAHKILNCGLPSPRHLFFSGRGAPYTPGIDKKRYSHFTDAELKDKILELGGTPAEFFEQPELMSLLFPLIKNDFMLAEYEIVGRKEERLPCNFTVFLGKDEALTAEQVVNWKDYTKGLCSIYYFNGKHFFINDNTQEIINRINSAL